MGRKLFLLFFAFLPSSWKVFWLRSQGHKVGEGVHIGICYLDVRRLDLGNRVKIGNFNYFKNVRLLEMADGARIGGKFNWITASRFNDMDDEGFGILRMRRSAGITGTHFFDLAGSITVGEETLIAGFRSTFMTHAMSADGDNKNAPISFGRRCYVGGQVIFLPGASLGDCSFAGSGAVVTKSFSELSHVLVAGNPAQVRKTYPPDAKWFTTEHDYAPKPRTKKPQ
jgi:acetyltransferase-like isoleucine patch superfamily enzyme